MKKSWTVWETCHIWLQLFVRPNQKAHYLGADVERAWPIWVKFSQSTGYSILKMRAGDLKWLIFEAHGKTYKTFCDLWNLSKPRGCWGSWEILPVLSLKDSLRGTKIQLRQPICSGKVWEIAGRYEELWLSLWLSLAEQEVDRAISSDRQLTIMKDFAPVAQRYLKHAKVNGLEKMTLLIGNWTWQRPNPEVTIDDALWFGHEVEPLGTRILSGEVACYQEERWVDIAVARILVAMQLTIPCILIPHELTGRLSDAYAWFMRSGILVSLSSWFSGARKRTKTRCA